MVEWQAGAGFRGEVLLRRDGQAGGHNEKEGVRSKLRAEALGSRCKFNSQIQGACALHMASQNGHAAAVKLLLGGKADAGAKFKGQELELERRARLATSFHPSSLSRFFVCIEVARPCPSRLERATQR